MSQRLSVQCWEPNQAHKAMSAQIWPLLKASLISGKRMVLTLAPETRSLKQNAVLWARLTDVSEQVEWYGKKLSQADWKHVFSSSLAKLKVVPNIDGTGFVALGLSTSNMTKAGLQDLNELIMAFGSDRTPPVKWSIASLCGDRGGIDPLTGEILT